MQNIGSSSAKTVGNIVQTANNTYNNEQSGRQTNNANNRRSRKKDHRRWKQSENKGSRCSTVRPRKSNAKMVIDTHTREVYNMGVAIVHLK